MIVSESVLLEINYNNRKQLVKLLGSFEGIYIPELYGIYNLYILDSVSGEYNILIENALGKCSFKRNDITSEYGLNLYDSTNSTSVIYQTIIQNVPSFDPGIDFSNLNIYLQFINAPLREDPKTDLYNTLNIFGSYCKYIPEPEPIPDPVL
jgi:hypothetical protein